jgi:hypothetical protein
MVITLKEDTKKFLADVSPSEQNETQKKKGALLC